ncbi:hypothetical protein GBA52_000185 [Prunus armeniaca]|nr:hypothetical protein GBA52_000185 [Prunus armeniaca]
MFGQVVVAYDYNIRNSGSVPVQSIHAATSACFGKNLDDLVGESTCQSQLQQNLHQDDDLNRTESKSAKKWNINSSFVLEKDDFPPLGSFKFCEQTDRQQMMSYNFNFSFFFFLPNNEDRSS